MSSSVSQSSRPKIVVTDSSVWVPKLYQIGEVYQNSNAGLLPRETLKEQIVDADALFCLVRDKIDKNLLEKARNLKLIATMSVGYDHIDVGECKKRGIRIGYTPGILTETTAELGLALLLATSRRIVEAAHSARSGGWVQWTPYYMCGKSIQNTIVGIYGMGKIGRNIAEKILPFKPEKIIYHNRNKLNDDENFSYVTFDKLLKLSDFLIVTVASTSENFQIFNKENFRKMKNDSIFINISRGTLVNHNDLYNALENKEIGAAGLDVLDPEPFPLDNPLFKLSNCVILPHIGSATFTTRNLMISNTEDNIYNFFTLKPMIAELNL